MLHRWSPRATVQVVGAAGPTGVATSGGGSGVVVVGGVVIVVVEPVVVVVDGERGARSTRWEVGTSPAGRVAAAVDPTTPSDVRPAAQRRARPGPRRWAARAIRSSWV